MTRVRRLAAEAQAQLIDLTLQLFYPFLAVEHHGLPAKQLIELSGEPFLRASSFADVAAHAQSADEPSLRVEDARHAQFAPGRASVLAGLLDFEGEGLEGPPGRDPFLHFAISGARDERRSRRE